MKRAAFLVAVLAVGVSGASRAEDPMPITSDTPGYCLGLAQRMAEDAVTMPPQVRVLWEQGRDLCQRGHIRGGLIRLRRAMMISRGVAE